MTGRAVDEWVGKTPDAKVPDRVRLRVFAAHGGICHLTGRKIRPGDPWDLDHVQALCNGGEHRESNLAPAIREAHREKTAQDVKLRAKADRVRKKHLGIWKPKTPMPGSRASKWKKPLYGPAIRRSDDD
ncbi:restriction endonuclease-like [Paracoccus phage Shpa]|uniref:Restriction endonuclease-like n=1 Tax=Paracoccus phage Shpa TaxID=1647282 RepID=A0A0U2C107_9CAUD|nr:restriction endonuclease-like [Paracoccus phage Shpa]AKG94545.1 restriction endonuclease-like [Paracoccus phage Shpa]